MKQSNQRAGGNPRTWKPLVTSPVASILSCRLCSHIRFRLPPCTQATRGETADLDRFGWPPSHHASIPNNTQKLVGGLEHFYCSILGIIWLIFFSHQPEKVYNDSNDLDEHVSIRSRGGNSQPWEILGWFAITLRAFVSTILLTDVATCCPNMNPSNVDLKFL